MRGTTHVVMAAALLLACAALSGAQQITAGEVLAADDFDRLTGTDLQIGTLPTGGQTWAKAVTAGGETVENLVRGRDGALWIGYASGRVNAPGVWVEGLRVADGVIELTVGPSTMGGRPHTSIISYRAVDGETAASVRGDGAYHLWLENDWSGSRDVALYYGNERLATADIAAEHDAQASYDVRIAFAGAHHVVAINGATVIDFWDWHGGREGPGFIGFGGYYSQGLFDDFVVRAATGHGGPQFDTAGGRIPPLVYQGRPFLPLGTYDRPGPEDTEEYIEAGGNAVILPVFDPQSEDRLSELQEAAQWGAEHDIAMVYFPRIDFYSHDGEQTIPTREEEIPEKIALIEEMLSVTANHPNTLGYWTFDEPENHLYHVYNEYAEKKDAGLAAWMSETMGWTYEAFKRRDPDAYVMPTIAWWTTYEGLAPLYDVNVPNTYAEGENLFQVLYDCVRAADAIRATDAHSYVFMPAVYDTAEWPNHDRREMRYSFIAPFTRGAMGILGWRLGRASMPYRRAVIYPVMREVDRLKKWLLGEWHDEKVTSDRDSATAPYLTELPERVKLIPGEEDAEMVEVPEDAVPDVAHCLRRAADNTWLLIAVSNRREPIDVTFTVEGIEGMPEVALEMIDWREVAIDDGKITDWLEPFAVRAYRIVPE